jgi:hypothetical protein
LKYKHSLTPESIIEEICYGSRGLQLLSAPIRCSYPHFQDLSPESILEEIWYGSRGLHLIGAPIRVLKRLSGTRSGSFSTRPEPNSTQRTISSREKRSTTSPR